MTTPTRNDRHRRRAATMAWWMVGAFALVGFAAACSSDAQSQLSEATGGTTPAASDDGSGGDDSSSGDGSSDDTSSDDSSGGDDSSSDDSSGGDDSSSGDDSSGSSDSSGGDGSGSSPDTEATTESGLTTEDWILIGIIGVAAFAIIIFATTAATRHGEQKEAASTAVNRQLSEVVGTSRWIHDSGSLEALRHTDADQLRSATNDVRQRMVDLEARIATTGTGDVNVDSALRDLGQALSGLRGSMDTLVTLRLGADAADQADLIENATQTYNRRRQELEAAIAPVAAAIR